MLSCTLKSNTAVSGTTEKGYLTIQQKHQTPFKIYIFCKFKMTQNVFMGKCEFLFSLFVNIASRTFAHHCSCPWTQFSSAPHEGAMCTSDYMKTHHGSGHKHKPSTPTITTISNSLFASYLIISMRPTNVP